MPAERITEGAFTHEAAGSRTGRISPPALPRVVPRERPLTQSVIEAIPTHCGDWCPDPNSRTALDLARHIVSAELRFLDGAAAGRFDYDGPTRPDLRTPAALANWYAEASRESLDRLERLSSRQLLQVIDFRGLYQFPAVVYLQFALNHTIHHRGQLSAYLRPMGARVPSIYGESFDHAQARRSAERDEEVNRG